MDMLDLLLKALRYSCLVLISGMIMLDIPILITIYNVNNTTFNPTFYIEELEMHGAYDIVKVSLVDIVLQYSGKYGGGGVVVPKETVAGIIDEIPNSWFENQSKDLITNVLSYLSGRTDELDLNISLVELKPMIADYIKNTTGAASDQNAQLPSELTTALGCTTLPDCLQKCDLPQNKPFCDQFQVSQYIASSNNVILSQVPDTVDLRELVKQAGLSDVLVQVRGYIKILLMLPLFLLALLAILGLIVVLITRQARAAAGWLGSGLFAGGILTVFTGVLFPIALKAGLNDYVMQSLPKNALFDVLVQIFFDLVQSIGRDITGHGVVLVIIGLLLLTTSSALWIVPIVTKSEKFMTGEKNYSN